MSETVSHWINETSLRSSKLQPTKLTKRTRSRSSLRQRKTFCRELQRSSFRQQLCVDYRLFVFGRVVCFNRVQAATGWATADSPQSASEVDHGKLASRSVHARGSVPRMSLENLNSALMQNSTLFWTPPAWKGRSATKHAAKLSVLLGNGGIFFKEHKFWACLLKSPAEGKTFLLKSSTLFILSSLTAGFRSNFFALFLFKFKRFHSPDFRCSLYTDSLHLTLCEFLCESSFVIKPHSRIISSSWFCGWDFANYF